MFLKQKYPWAILLSSCLAAVGAWKLNYQGVENTSSKIVGTNLAPINYYSTEFPFLNEFKSSNVWLTQDQGVWNTQEADLLNLDSHGWIESLPKRQSKVQYREVGTLIFREHNSYLPGRYIVLYDGEGNLDYGFDGQKQSSLSTPGRDVVEVAQTSKQGLWLRVTASDPQQTGNYIRNIRIVPEAYEAIADQEVFNPEFLAKIEPFGTLRFMDWQQTNNSRQSEWSDRPEPEDARYYEQGVPVETMVQLANQTNSNPWFTMPHQANDQYIANFAQYVRDNLKPHLAVYVEYSNETWNWRLEQTKWIEQQSQQQRLDPSLNKTDWYSQRTSEVMQIWDKAFGAEAERVIGVMGGQAANVGILEQALSYRWSEVALSHAEAGIDAIAIAPYFGSYIGSPQNAPTVSAWTQEADGGKNKLFEELNQGGLVADGPPGGALALAYENMALHQELAASENLLLLAYEGGQHLAANRGVENNQAVTELFIAANRDPRMGAIYQEYLTQWFGLGGDLFLHFNNVDAPRKWGSWGALESLYQDSSPKYDALINFIRHYPERQQ
ncbi:MAG: cellulose-binding protein [Cyanobacteria bacterium J06629_2]